MATFLICYDLNKEGADYAAANKKLTDRIKEVFSPRWHHLDSTWIVVSEMTAKQIKEDLKSYIDKDDELLIVKTCAVASWCGFSDSASKWLMDHI